MRRFVLGVLAALALVLCAPAARAQTYLPVPADSYGFCFNLAVPQTVSASCTVTVYDAGTSNISTIYSNDSGGAQLNPFTAGSNGTWRFYGTAGSAYDIRISGGLPALVPYTITDVAPPGSFGTAPPYTVFGNCTGSTAAPGFCSLVAAMLPALGSSGQFTYNNAGTMAGNPNWIYDSVNSSVVFKDSNAVIMRFHATSPGSGGQLIFGSGTAPSITNLTDWNFLNNNAHDVTFSWGSCGACVRLGGNFGAFNYGTMALGTGAFTGTIFLNDGNQSAGVFFGPALIAGFEANPNSVHAANPGSLFVSTNGVATKAVWVKESGSGNTGWQQFAMQDDVQTLTNKALSDGTTAVVNSSDATKKVAFNNSGMSGSTTQTITPTATANRILTLPDASITVSGLTAYSCGTTATCANTGVVAPHMIYGQVALSSGTPSTATVASIAPAFTSTTSYQCTATDMSAGVNNALQVTNTSTSSFMITGPNTITDTISYMCIGQ